MAKKKDLYPLVGKHGMWTYNLELANEVIWQFRDQNDLLRAKLKSISTRKSKKTSSKKRSRTSTGRKTSR